MTKNNDELNLDLLEDLIFKLEIKEAVENAEGLDDEIRGLLLEGVIDKLCKAGGVTHHCGMVDSQTGEVSHEGLPENESAYNIVRRYKIEKPDQDSFLKHSFYDTQY